MVQCFKIYPYAEHHVTFYGRSDSEDAHKLNEDSRKANHMVYRLLNAKRKSMYLM